MLITLIGTSGSGKSYWAKRLATEAGYTRFCCDDLIEKRLHTELGTAGLHGITGVAEWMGKPGDPDSERKQKAYLSCEVAVMGELIEMLAAHPTTDNIVIDTTGSFIYCGEEICNKLSELSHVVYLEADRDSLEHMAAQFLRNPKPIVWDSLFAEAAKQSTNEGLANCYKELVTARAARYRRYAQVVIPFAEHKKRQLPISAFLQLVHPS